MRNLLFIISIIITLVSCSNSNKVKFINESDIQIDSILLIGNQKCNPLVIKKLLPNNTITGFLENCNESVGDGSYIVEIYSNKSKTTKGFGYYTNGFMCFDEFEIKFSKNNTIIVKEKY